MISVNIYHNLETIFTHGNFSCIFILFGFLIFYLIFWKKNIDEKNVCICKIHIPTNYHIYLINNERSTASWIYYFFCFFLWHLGKSVGSRLFLEYCQHSYEYTVYTFQILCQLAEKSKRYDTFHTKNVRARRKSIKGGGQGQFSR